MKLPLKKTGRTLRLVAGALAASGVAGCFTLGVGLPPPARELYYPTAILTSPGQKTLYVVNSDFDIQYTGGTVQAVDLEGVRACVSRLASDLSEGMSGATACADVGLQENTDPVLVPGPCAAVDLNNDLACKLAGVTDDPDTAEIEDGRVTGPLLKTSRVIGAFASSATLVQKPTSTDDPEAAERLFVAVRGDPSVTFFETTNDSASSTGDPYRLDCLQEGNDPYEGTCGSFARVGSSPNQSVRMLSMPVEPNGVAASDDGAAIVAVHQTGGANSTTHGQASLIVNAWGALPALTYTLTGLPDYPSDVAAIPTAKFVTKKKELGEALDYRPGFLVTFRAAPEVDLLRYFDDSAGTSRSFLQRVGAFSIQTNSDGSDSRGIAISDFERKACEADCDEDDLACLRACVDVPLLVFVANRAPASLLIGRLETQVTLSGAGKISSLSESVSLNDMVPLAAGASRVAVGNVLDLEGNPSPRVFVISFDSRYVVIYDPAQHRVEAAVRTGRGPHALAVDTTPKSAAGEGSALLYVAHFTDSYIGVIDLDTRHTGTYGSMFAAVGVPKPPKESK